MDFLKIFLAFNQKKKKSANAGDENIFPSLLILLQYMKLNHKRNDKSKFLEMYEQPIPSHELCQSCD